MKIFKQPQFNICTCEVCGTVFQPEPSDTFEYRFSSIIEKADVFIRCPTCERYCEVTIAEETKNISENKNETK